MASRVLRVAVMCWFPTESNPIPISIKFKDDTGEIRQIKDIHIISTSTISQGKNFICDAVVSGIKQEFELTFFSEDCRWLLKI